MHPVSGGALGTAYRFEEDVPFDDGVADALIAAAKGAADGIEGQAGSRSGYVSTGSSEFRGRFSELFASNARVAAADAGDLVSALRAVADGASYLKEEARKEQERRQTARNWLRERESRSQLQKALDGVWEGLTRKPDPPVGPPAQPVPPAVPEVNTGNRETPAPGDAGGSGTSSAVPANLRSFATGSAGLNEALRGKPGDLRSRLADFAASCRWGTLSADGVVASFEAWLSANDQDVDWATTVADAFAAAGGEGEVSTLTDAALSAALQARGVSESREDLEVAVPETVGAPPTSGYANDPVNAGTGNFLEPETDVGFAGGSASLRFARMYNSLLSGEEDSGFGPGWSSATGMRLVFSEEGAEWVTEEGRRIVFPRSGSGWDRAVGANLWLERERDASGVSVLVVRDAGARCWTFGEQGRWLSSSAGAGTAVAGEYDAAGRLVRLVHERGRWLRIEWGAVAGAAAERVVGVSASDGRRVAFEYDVSGRLVSAAGPAGVRGYEWDERGLLVRVRDAAGVVEAENSYDDAGRVVSQRSPFGRVTRFAYLPGRVMMTGSAGDEERNTWISDRFARVVGVVDAAGRRASMSYDRWGNLVSATDREGRVTVHAYDGRGRRVRTVTPSGGEITWGYDELGRVTTVVAAHGGTTRFEYADDEGRDPVAIVDPEGGRSRLRWERGLLQEVVDPAGVRVRLGYDEYGDVVSSTNAAGDVARLERDAAGRVVAAVSPGGARTEYRYDESGRLVSRREPDGGVWGYEHDAAGRVVATVAPDGGRTQLEYDPGHGGLVATRDALGRVVGREFDEFGRVVGAVLPDGARWEFGYDGLSRLREIVDPAGGVWERSYGPDGQLTGMRDPSGVAQELSRSLEQEAGPVEPGRRPETIGSSLRVSDAFESARYRFDRYGRPEQWSGPDGSSELVSYDACGRPVELVDGEGGLTRLERDAAGRIVRIVSPAGRETRFEYDACGRPAVRIDPGGARTELVYDADSRVVVRRLPDGSEERFVYDPCGRLIRRARPGAGTARYRYDRCGRLVFVQDAAFGRRLFRYDRAGQLIAAVNGLGGTTRYEYDARGRLVRITDPLGAVTTRSYTELDKVASVTDPGGAVTTAGYDPAGRQLWQKDPDGRLTEWSYDRAGRQQRVSVDGRIQAEIEREVRRNRVRITDHTRPGDEGPVVHELAWNRRGQLLSRSRDGRGLAWAYDPDGRRTEHTGPDGERTRYEYDANGRLHRIRHLPHPERPDGDAQGRELSADFAYDAAGRLVQAATPGALHRWSYTDGALTGHTVTTPERGLEETRIERDRHGRITALHTPAGSTGYQYDRAGQLTASSHTPAAGSVRRHSWSYDLAGRLRHERHQHPERTSWQRGYHYDPAGRLLRSEDSRTGITRYRSDGTGRRTRVEHPDGSSTRLHWNRLGWAAGTTHSTGTGIETDRRVWTDALGEPATITSPTGEPQTPPQTTDGTIEAWWDTAAPFPVLAQLAGESILTAPGGLLAVADSWTDPAGGQEQWRTARPTDPTDPWSIPIHPLTAGEPDHGLGITGLGSLALAGMEWLGPRQYDPDTRAFTSTDPLPPVPGAVWAANPYAYAGNDPLHTSDPSGLRPITDAELQAHQQANQGLLAQAGDWLANNWEYLAAGAAIVAGVALMCTGVGGPAGLALMAASGALLSGGISVATQKYQNGSVDWGQVGVEAAIGGIGGAVGGGVAAAASRAGVSTVAANTVSEIAEGGITSAAEYLTGPGPHNPVDFLTTTATGAAMGGIPFLPGPANRTDLPTSNQLVDLPPGATHETYYRVMSERHYNRLVRDGEVPATGETFISPSREYAEKYNGALVELNVQPGTRAQLEQIGVRDPSPASARDYPDMPLSYPGWNRNNAYFKNETGVSYRPRKRCGSGSF
ncbi:MAG: DUF6531 domain-containing protein [Pseudoclavibacter sp.]|nr:DUF6531 domain-containing protein [Pseudoclavibacter sp.]